MMVLLNEKMVFGLLVQCQGYTSGQLQPLDTKLFEVEMPNLTYYCVKFGLLKSLVEIRISESLHVIIQIAALVKTFVVLTSRTNGNFEARSIKKAIFIRN